MRQSSFITCVYVCCVWTLKSLKQLVQFLPALECNISCDTTLSFNLTEPLKKLPWIDLENSTPLFGKVLGWYCFDMTMNYPWTRLGMSTHSDTCILVEISVRGNYLEMTLEIWRSVFVKPFVWNWCDFDMTLICPWFQLNMSIMTQMPIVRLE